MRKLRFQEVNQLAGKWWSLDKKIRRARIEIRWVSF